MVIYIDRNGQRLGPYPLDQVNQCLEQGSLLPTDSAWHDGMTDWVPLNQINGVIIPGESPAPPPPPAGTPSAPPSVIEGSTCPACQTPINSGQAFCMGCGANLQSGQAPTLQTTTQSAGKKKLLIGIGAGVGVLALAAVGFFVIYPKLSGDGANQESSETIPGPSNEQKTKMAPPLPDDIPSLKAFLEPGANQLSAAHKTKAQYKLGKLLKEKASEAKYLTKERMELDYEAEKHLTPAAENGHALAQFELGSVLLSKPVGSREEAIKWFKKSAEQGSMKAASQLGWMHFAHGRDGPQEQIFLECIKWNTMAAENGYPNAAYKLGCCYYPWSPDMSPYLVTYLASKIDVKKAYVWWSIASKRNFSEDYGDEEASKAIESLKKRNLMTLGQLSEADALVEKMIKDNTKLIELFLEE